MAGTGARRWLPEWAPALLVLLIALTVRGINPAFVEEWRLRGFDALQRLAPRVEPDNGAVIVAIDEETLAAKGQWPWPRTLVAELVRRIADGKPKVLGIDILFSEPDRFSPPRLPETLQGLPADLAAGLRRLPPSEAALADAIAAVPTVLVSDPSREAMPPAAGPQPVIAPVRQIGQDPRPFLVNYPSLINSQPRIVGAAAAIGSAAGDPDIDGILRRIPLAVVAEGRLVPGFAAEVSAVADRRPSLVIRSGRGVAQVEAGAEVAPTDRFGRAILHFAPPQMRYYSAADVLDPAFDAGRFAGRIVLLGVTALGIVDQKRTPLGLTEGVHVHAQLIDSIRDRTLLHRPPAVFWVEVTLILIAALVPISLIEYRHPFVATAAVLGLTAALIGGEYAAFRLARFLVDGLYPGATALATFGMMLADHLRNANAARRRLNVELADQRERNARLAGELEAARAIQMGLLPRRFPVFTERDDIDLYAFVEPARQVGGDLFVFQIVDNDQLFFLIGDVSGKGIGAALFMAMTSEVVHEAARRYGAALDAVLTEANAKIAAASGDMAREGGDMMFVTAFAGVLDLASGALTYASAGHDGPFLVQPGARPRCLETEGGPPLGVIEDFAFPIDHDRLEPGAVLLLYTDGITEATDASGTLYGKERLGSVLAGTVPDDARSVIEAVTAAVKRFAAGTEQADDMALLALRRLLPASADASRL